MFGGGATAAPFGWSASLPASSPAAAFGSGLTSSSSSSSSTPFGAQPPPFAAPATAFHGSAAAFGSPSPSPSFGQTAGLFTNASQPAFGSANPFGQPSSLFRPPQSAPAFGQLQPASLAQAQGQTLLQFGQAAPAPSPAQLHPAVFGAPQLTTQMAPVAPLSVPLPDRELQAIVDAYKDDLSNPRYAFRHLFLSVTDPSLRTKPLGVSDIMWAEAMNKLEGMDSSDRDKLWPELVQGFKDLSRRLKLQDEALVSDAQRLQETECNVKKLKRHFEADTLPWIQRLRQKEQELQRRLLKIMRITEALESKGFQIPLMKGEGQIGERLQLLSRQLQGPRAELPRRVNALLSISRMHASVGGSSTITAILGMGKIDEQSLADMHEVLQKQTEAIRRLVNVLKRDMRDLEIITAEDINMPDDQPK